jgi:hypothetical protein
MEDEEDGDARITALAGGLGPGENMLEVWIKGGQLIEGAGGGLLDTAATTFVMCGTWCQWRKGERGGRGRRGRGGMSGAEGTRGMRGGWKWVACALYRIGVGVLW